MKSVITMIANVVAVLVIIYLPFAFILNEWNPSNWHITLRALYVLILVALMTVGYDQYRKR